MQILFEDDHLIAINKPNGLLVHRSPMANDVQEFALQQVRNYCGEHVYLVHRLDRKTSGVLLFSKKQELVGGLQQQIQESAQKTYIAIVRGHTEESGIIDYDLTSDNGKVQNAVTHYHTISQSDLPFQTSTFPTSRYSLVEIKPKTGRFHQIRKHFAHIRHPIIGDRPHGCNKQNRYFKQHFNMTTMLLHAQQLELQHPMAEKPIVLIAEIPSEFKRMQVFLELSS